MSTAPYGRRSGTDPRVGGSVESLGGPDRHRPGHATTLDGPAAAEAAERRVAGRLWLASGLGLLLLLLAVGLVVAGCGGPGKHQGGGGASPSPSVQGNPVAYAQCMRANGLPNFPDPDANGGIRVDPQKGLDPNSPEFEKAQKKCESLMGNGAKANPSEGDLWPLDKKLKYAQCMRDNGQPGFPDPDNTGQFPPFPKGGNIDPQSEQFKKADDVCKQYKPSGTMPGGGPGGPGGPGGGGPGGGPAGGGA
jgi:hypothetical protein